jgi:tRNA (guanine10-N2)-dimethyltransferase
MPTYLFHLGREPGLSIAEIESLFTAERIPGEEPCLVGHALEISTPEGLDPRGVIARLGGTIRIAEKIASLDPGVSAGEAAEAIFNEIRRRTKAEERKFSFGLSYAGSARSRWSPDLEEIAKTVKEMARKEGLSVRFILPRKGQSLSGAQVEENGLIGRGVEFLLSSGESGVVLGRTVAVQGFQEDADRDMQKPDRRVYEGLLPPKLARILVNLSRRPDTRSLIDPFCGSGVLLIEALALGLDVYGVDRDTGALEASRRNLEWFSERARVQGKYRLRPGDSRNLSEYFKPLSIDAAATEPDLGPPLRRPLSFDQAKEAAAGLRDLYARVLAELRIVLKPGSRCTFITPIFMTDRGPFPVSIERDLTVIGYRTWEPVWKVKGAEGHKELVHRRPGQKVARRIHLLEA